VNFCCFRGEAAAGLEPTQAQSTSFNSFSSGGMGSIENRTVACAAKSIAPIIEQIAGRLVRDMQFPAPLALAVAAQDTGRILVDMVKSNEQLSEDDPLLFLVPEMTADGVAYWKDGNYGLPVGTPGSAAPPAGIMCAAIPLLLTEAFLILFKLSYLFLSSRSGFIPGQLSLGQFVASLPGVTDRTQGGATVFFVANPHYLDMARVAVSSNPQFRRYGPVLAAAFGIPPEPAFLAAFQLTTLTGPPFQLHFNDLP
jgi:hypothetical protein